MESMIGCGLEESDLLHRPEAAGRDAIKEKDVTHARRRG
jgi:hypothetical protein